MRPRPTPCERVGERARLPDEECKHGELGGERAEQEGAA